MRAICETCEHRSKCTYVKQGKERDCIDVQTTDIGYEEAVAKAKEWFNSNWRNYINKDADGMIRFAGWQHDFEQAML